MRHRTIYPTCPLDGGAMDDTGCCPLCHVLLDHDPCPTCRQIGYHRDNCTAALIDDADAAALARYALHQTTGDERYLYPDAPAEEAVSRG